MCSQNRNCSRIGNLLYLPDYVLKIFLPDVSSQKNLLVQYAWESPDYARLILDPEELLTTFNTMLLVATLPRQGL